MEKVHYAALNSRQQEIYNFHKVAAVLADYGYNCIKLADDWNGADFLAYHFDGDSTMRVQLKGRPYVDKKYIGRKLFMAFPISDDWYLVQHEELMEIFEAQSDFKATRSWQEGGAYGWPRPSVRGLAALQAYRL